MSDKKGLKRKDLYDLVWSKPLTTLAKELNFDAYNLRKICKQHNIPLPQSGHWQKIKHNKKVSKTTFPVDVEKDKTIILYLDEKGHVAYNPPGKIKSKLKTEIETSKELSLKVPETKYLLKPAPAGSRIHSSSFLIELKFSLSGYPPFLHHHIQT